MMKYRIPALCLLVCILAFALFACASRDAGKEKDIVGYWYSDTFTYQFYESDGTFRFEGWYSGGSYASGTYRAGTEVLTLYVEESGGTTVFGYSMPDTDRIRLSIDGTVVTTLQKRAEK